MIYIRYIPKYIKLKVLNIGIIRNNKMKLASHKSGRNKQPSIRSPPLDRTRCPYNPLYFSIILFSILKRLKLLLIIASVVSVYLMG